MNKYFILFVCGTLCFSPLIATGRSICENEFNSTPKSGIKEGKNDFQGNYSKESLAERKKLAEQSLERTLNRKQVEAIEKAHRVGMGEKGKDGTPAQIGNYTEVQKREKYKTLRQIGGLSKEEAKKLMQDGVVGWKFWKKPPSTHIVAELSQESTEVTSYIRSYNAHLGFDDLNKNIGFFIKAIADNPGIAKLKYVGDYHYWGRYVPTREVIPDVDRSLKYRGKFIIGFGVVMKNSKDDTRAGYWAHHIHWDSGARDMPNLDEEIVKKIFTEIYGERDPQQLMTEMQPQYYLEDPISGDITQRFIFPFIYDDKKKAEVKQIILRVLRDRGYQVASEIQN